MLHDRIKWETIPEDSNFHLTITMLDYLIKDSKITDDADSKTFIANGAYITLQSVRRFPQKEDPGVKHVKS